MTPAQRLTLSARQAAEQAQRLLTWLEHGRSGRPEIAGLIDEIESIAGDVGRVLEAIETRPAIGIAGGHRTGKTALLSALTGAAEQPLRAEFSNREASLDILASLLPNRAGAQTSAAVRLSNQDLPPAPRGFPVRVRIIGQLDLIKLVFRAHASHIGAPPSHTPSAPAVANFFAEAERQLQPRAVAGLSARDVVELREDVHGFDPFSPLLRVLSAAGYWDRLALTVAHLPEVERTRLVALLWNEEPVLTAIYTQLNAAIEKLGHATEVFCELGALVTREPATGWMVPHRASIIAADTLAGLAHALGPMPASTVQVSGRFGGSVALDRSVMAALVSELPLTLTAPPVHGLAETDIITFPGAPSVADLLRADPAQAPSLAMAGVGGVRGGLGAEAAVTILSQAKAVFLLDRAAHRHQLACLVTCLDPAQPPDDAFAGAIGDWIDTEQGAEPHHRERVRTGLFVVVTRPLPVGSAASRIEPWRDAASDASVRRSVTDGIGVDQDWPGEWTPNHPFDNYFAFDRPVRGAGPRFADTHLRLVGGSTPNAASASCSADALVRALSAVAIRSKRHRLLGLHLGGLRRRLRSRVLRHHLSNDPMEIAEWRRQVANVAVNRLRRPMPGARAASVSAGTLVSALAASDAELAAAIGLAAIEPQSGGGGRAESRRASENPSFRHDSASAAVTYWFRAMRQSGRSARFCRHVGVPQTVMQHVIDELAIGAVRTGVAADMTAAFSRLPAAGSGRTGAPVHLAATAVRIIDAYLASIPRPVAESAPGRPSRAPSEPAPGSAGRQLEPWRATVLAGRAAGFGGAGWTSAVAALVEANISAVSGLVDAAERDRELGELLTGFASSPFEVEL